MTALAPLALVLALAAPPARWVTDEAHALSATQRAAIDARLELFEKTTGHQVLVYLDQTTGTVPLEDFAVRTFKEWRVGRAGLDDGAVLFVFLRDRAARIEVGYGLEATLTDVESSRILREVLSPGMASGDVDGAVAKAVDAIIAALGNVPGPSSAPAFPAPPPLPGWAVAVAVALFILLAIWKPRLAWFLLMMMTGRRRGRSGGGGFHGGGGRSGGAGASGRW